MWQPANRQTNFGRRFLEIRLGLQAMPVVTKFALVSSM